MIKCVILLILFWLSYLLDFVFDGQFNAAEARSVVGARGTLVNVAIQYGLHFLCVSTKVQHAHNKVLTLHRQLPVVILCEPDAVRREETRTKGQER